MLRKPTNLVWILLLLGAVAAIAWLLLRGDGEDPGHDDAPTERTGAPRLQGTGRPATAAAQTEEAPRPAAHLRLGEAAETGVVEGRLTDEEGRPLDRADVILWDATGREVVARMSPDDDGRFRFADLADDRYRLVIHARGGARLGREVQPGGPSLQVTLEVAGVSPIAYSDRVTSGEALSAGVVSGCVFDGEGRPLEGADVALRDRGRLSHVGKTDVRGEFAFTGVADRWHVLGVHAAGWRSVAHPVRSGAGFLEIRLDRGPSISGVVVERDGGEPVAGIFVASIGPRYQTVRTTEDGAFLFGGLDEAAYTLKIGGHAPSPDDPTAVYLPVRVDGVPAGKMDVRIEVVRGLSLAGVIHGPDGAPWTGGAEVRVSPVARDGSVHYAGQRNVAVADDGTFRIPGLAPGRYDLTAVPDAASGNATRPCVLLRRGVPAGTEGLVLELSIGVPLEGRLVDEMGAAVEGEGWVWVSPSGTSRGEPGSVAATLEDGGRFVTDPLDPGRSYDVHASGFAGYLRGETKGVHPGDLDVVVVVPRGLRIHGWVTVSGGTPAPAGVPVHALASGPREYGYQGPAWSWKHVRAKTDAAGRFVLGGLHEVPYHVVAGGGDSGLLPSKTASEVTPPGKDVVLVVSRGVALYGRLVDQTGEAPPPCVIQATPVDGLSSGRTAWTWSRPDGGFAFAGVAPGRLKLAAMIGGARRDLGLYRAPAEDVTIEIPE